MGRGAAAALLGASYAPNGQPLVAFDLDYGEDGAIREITVHRGGGRETEIDWMTYTGDGIMEMGEAVIRDEARRCTGSA